MMCQTNGTDVSYPQGQGNGQQDRMERNTYLRDGTNTNTQVSVMILCFLEILFNRCEVNTVLSVP